MPPNKSVLARQLERLGLNLEMPPNALQWKKFIERVQNHYQECEEDRYLLERSLEISSEEMKERFRKNNLLVAQLQTNQQVLNDLLHNVAFDQIMAKLAINIELRLPGFQCAIFGTRDDQSQADQLELIAAPSLPEPIRQALTKLPIDPNGCPCGMAAARKCSVSLTSIDSQEAKERMAPMGVGACHAFPVLSESGRVMAVFSLFALEPISLTDDQNELMKSLSGVVQMTVSHVEIKAALDQEHIAAIARSKLATLGEMAGGVAHEINNPLFILQGYVDIIRAMVEDNAIDPTDLTSTCDQISSNIQRIARIVKTLRNFSRDASNDPLEPTLLRDIVDDALELCSKRFEQIQIEATLPKDPNIQINCRSVEITQVLVNLINNACHEVKDRPDPWVKIEVSLAANQVEIRVTDSGHGIQPAIVEKLFRPFFTTKRPGEGTGLGLSICKRIVESHAGKLAYNPNHEHTQFVVELPILQEAA